MRKINIERLIDAVVDEFGCYAAYIRQSKGLYNGTVADFQNRKAMVHELLNYHDRQQSVVWALMEVLQMDTNQRQRLYIAARAVERWRVNTNYSRFIPEGMRRQIEQFIFEEEGHE